LRTIIAAVIILAALAGAARAEPTGPSFNCNYAKTPDEVIICQHTELSRKDREMADLYSDIMNMFRAGFRDYVRRTQVAWLSGRRLCGYSADCVSKAYDYRLSLFYDGDVELADWCRAGHMADVDCRDQAYLKGAK
jgi:uncharacterized protein